MFFLRIDLADESRTEAAMLCNGASTDVETSVSVQGENINPVKMILILKSVTIMHYVETVKSVVTSCKR